MLQKQHLPTSLPALWAQGFGKSNPNSLVRGPMMSRSNLRGADQLFQILFANAFQLLVSFLYLVYNNILTCQVVAGEMMRFLSEKKALRVSSPKNATQRSSYFLSLPWSYAIPQMTAFVLLHWLVSQSVFTVQTTSYGPGPSGQRIPSTDASRIGYSTFAILLSSLLGSFLVLLLAANSLRSYPNVPRDLPRMATNSAAIQANCHRPLQDWDAHLYLLRLGVVRHGVELKPGCEGRLTFSSDAEIEEPLGGVSYEIATWVEIDDGERKKRGGIRSYLRQRWA
jgi:hypothetical protein